MNCPQNPWLNISWNNTIADCDKQHLVLRGKYLFGSDDYVNYVNRNDKEKNNQPPVELTFKDCLPEPFFGDINSEVYLLNMNPGKPDLDFCKSNDKFGEYEKYCQAMLKHMPLDPGLLYDNGTIIYDSPKYKSILDGIFNNKQVDLFKKNRGQFPIRPHAGDVWQREAWKKLRDSLNRDPKLFIIEYFPYHSTSGFSFPKDLPSNVYRNHLVRQAMNAKKLIVIMRQAKMWYNITDDNLGNDLANYPNKITLSCKGRIWLTPGNFVIPPRKGNEPAWVCKSVNDILNKF